ncbi:DNA-binding transcriptional ArsR family regulator [Phycicoccus badiiscoriae]|uniref:DNA-binding transcriptional ArsR family regulator n=1 Tax=Pedococcus badiiscoriae TaxID=642776 RepID=A0A852WGP3_9MICO|nr:metalloregulator ArsR/SmtB family transcription factor [Pedococcus badiiscoriae]NYG07990.1 DNA-binding transcriptional ArsR family regulator [Pedococcus badiiscoriae]
MDDPLSSTFAALADPTRRAILERLAGGDATVGELAEPFAMTLPAISKHLSVLERAGLIAKDRDGQRRHCRITATPLKSATSWLEEYRRHWEANLDHLDAYLTRIQGPASPTSPGAPTTATTATTSHPEDQS